MTLIYQGHRLLEITVVDLGIGIGVGVDVHMHKVECELMGGSRGDKIRIWTNVPLQVAGLCNGFEGLSVVDVHWNARGKCV
jgi:hypothetical protein